MNPDGVSYLNMGEAYLRGDWATAINSVWSPLYSWILGLALLIVNPPLEWEFPLVHALNLLIFLGTLACFEFFWLRLVRSQVGGRRQGETIGLPEWAWLAIGYTLFIWSSLTLTGVWAVTPDMLMAAFVYLAAGLTLRIGVDGASRRRFALLGMVLGIGYLAKAVMFPLALVFLGAAALVTGSARVALPRVLLALAIFVAISSPFVAAISSAKGRLTFGDVGKLTYAWQVNGVPYPHWQGETADVGTPLHPSRRVLDVPPIYEFGTPVGGTYPISYDPSYWYEGVAIRVDPGQQARMLLVNGLLYFDLFFRQQGALLAGVLVLYAMGTRARSWLREMVLPLAVIVPALAAFSMYALVYVEGRYLSPFLLLFWGGLLAGVRLPDHRDPRRLASIVGAVVLAFMLASLVEFNLQGMKALQPRVSMVQTAAGPASAPARPEQVAQELHRLGVEPGAKVAVIGYGFDSYWARLARVQIVAEMLGWEADPFWLGDDPTRERVVEAFAGTGARAIVAERVPSYAKLVDWHRVESTNYYIYVLPDR